MDLSYQDFVSLIKYWDASFGAYVSVKYLLNMIESNFFITVEHLSWFIINHCFWKSGKPAESVVIVWMLDEYSPYVNIKSTQFGLTGFIKQIASTVILLRSRW